jgi:type II secretory pathway pseudopilin PulG
MDAPRAPHARETPLVGDAWARPVADNATPGCGIVMTRGGAVLAIVLIAVLAAMLIPIVGDCICGADQLAATKSLGDLGKAANQYALDHKRWPMANGASFWVSLYQAQYVTRMGLFLSGTSGDDNSMLAWPIGLTKPVVTPAAGDVSFSGPRDWMTLYVTPNSTLIGSDDSEGPAHFDDGMATVERNGRAQYLTWPEIKPGAVEGIRGQVKVGDPGSRLALLAD